MTKEADELTEAASVLEPLVGNTDEEAAAEAGCPIIDAACCSEDVAGEEASRDDVAGPAWELDNSAGIADEPSLAEVDLAIGSDDVMPCPEAVDDEIIVDEVVAPSSGERSFNSLLSCMISLESSITSILHSNKRCSSPEYLGLNRTVSFVARL